MVVSALIVIGLLVYATLDNLQTPSEELRISRGLWLAVIVLLPIIGPVAWLVSGRIRAPRHARGAEPKPYEPGPSGPDDDPDFLAELGRTQRRRPPAPPKPLKREKPKDKKPVDEPIDPDAS